MRAVAERQVTAVAMESIRVTCDIDLMKDVSVGTRLDSVDKSRSRREQISIFAAGRSATPASLMTDTHPRCLCRAQILLRSPDGYRKSVPRIRIS